MDWYSWLSNTNLDPPLIFDYSLSFSRNQLQQEDLAYFNHEFLQSMGISVAKHRLEILKLAKKEASTAIATTFPNGALSKLISKTMKRFNNYVKNKLQVHHRAEQPDAAAETVKALPGPKKTATETATTGGGGFSIAIARQCNNEKEVMKVDQPIPKLTRKVAKSGPLEMRAREHLMNNNVRCLKFSGPLDRKMDDRLLFSYRSPILSGPVDMNKSPRFSRTMVSRPQSPKFYTKEERLVGYNNGVEYGDQSLWATLFQDMRPT